VCDVLLDHVGFFKFNGGFEWYTGETLNRALTLEATLKIIHAVKLLIILKFYLPVQLQ
jgi:hypothetical protein